MLTLLLATFYLCLCLESAIRAIRHNGLLGVTATDTAVLCSNREKCFAKYNTVIKRNPVSHEHALRTLLSFISRAASKYNAGIVPLVSVSVDFYVRVFVKVVKSKKEAKKSLSRNSLYFLCDCLNFLEVPLCKNTEISSLCSVCRRNMKLCGPFWNGEMQDKDFIRSVKDEGMDKRIMGVLHTIVSEIDVFGYFSISDMAKFVRSDAISMKKLACAILNAGYKVSITHCKLNAIKTNAPVDNKERPCI